MHFNPVNNSEGSGRLNHTVINKQTLTSQYLSALVFNNQALPTLRSFGLINVYLDDYGHSKRHSGDCLFFLFSNKNKPDYDSFERKIADFASFHDYYEVPQPEDLQRMYIFKVHPAYRRDLFSFKYNRLDELSEQFFRVVDPQINVSELKVELDKEIYRFNNYLEIIKEGL
jgi:hypothetical protein